MSTNFSEPPPDFPYREVFLRGKPQHTIDEGFGARHPRMSCGKRAKIFAPFDALRGFREAVAGKETEAEIKAETEFEFETEDGKEL